MSAGVGFRYTSGYEYEYAPTSAAKNPYTAPRFEPSAFFPITNDGKYMMEIKVMKSDASCMVPLECMDDVELASDSGADMILLTRDVADMLGYQVDMLSEDYNFMVQGKSGEPTIFKEVTTWIQIGNMRPLQVQVGLAVDTDALVENLFGNKGTIDSGQITASYSNRGVLYTESMNTRASSVSII